MVPVSIVVPIHNSAQYLPQCIQSIRSQSFGDFELICVDDGSTDSSLALLDRYADEDHRVRVITQANEGPGAARNAGMQHATGKYLLFWDSDDFFEPRALELLYETCEEHRADVCVCNSWHYYEDIDFNDPVNASLNVKRLPSAIPFSAREHWDYILNFTNTVAWNKMFRRDYVQSGGFRFGNTRISEDAQFVCPALCCAQTIAVVNKRLVHYRRGQVGNALAGLATDGRSSFIAWEQAYRELKERGCLPEVSFANRVIATCAFVLGNIGDWETFQRAIDTVREIGPANIGIINSADEDVYRDDWHRVFSVLLYEGKPEDILVSLMGHFREQQQRTAVSKRKLNQNLRRKIKNASNSALA